MKYIRLSIFFMLVLVVCYGHSTTFAKTANVGDTVWLNYSTQNVTLCNPIFGPNGYSAPLSILNAQGAAPIFNVQLSNTGTYTLSCSGPGGPGSASDVLTVVAPNNSGQCGSAANTPSATAPTTNLCNSTFGNTTVIQKDSSGIPLCSLYPSFPNMVPGVNTAWYPSPSGQTITYQSLKYDPAAWTTSGILLGNGQVCGSDPANYSDPACYTSSQTCSRATTNLQWSWGCYNKQPIPGGSVPCSAPSTTTSPPQPTGTLTIGTCTIKAGEGLCAPTIGWTSSNAVVPLHIVRGYGPGDIANGTNLGANSTPATQITTTTWPFGLWPIILEDNATPLNNVLAQGTVTAVCTTNATWNGATCTCNPNFAQQADGTCAPIFTLTTNVYGPGSVTSIPAGVNCVGANPCPAPFTSGTVVTLTATPGTNAVFSGWQGACSGMGSCTVTTNQNTSVTANFACNAGYSPSGSTCVQNTCPATTMSWGNGNCQATIPLTNAGSNSAPVGNSLTNGYQGSASWTCNNGGTWSSTPISGSWCNPPVPSSAILSAYPRTVESGKQVTLSWSIADPDSSCTLTAQAVCSGSSCAAAQGEQATINLALSSPNTTDANDPYGTRDMSTAIQTPTSSTPRKALGKKTITISHSMDFILKCGTSVTTYTQSKIRTLVTNVTEG